MQKYKAKIKVIRLYEMYFHSPDPKQAAVDAETILAQEAFDDTSHIGESKEITAVAEDKTDNESHNTFVNKCDRKKYYR